MKRSVRNRIMLIFIGLMVIMLLTIWIVNNFFLEDYYTRQKLRVMEDAYTEVNELIMDLGASGESLEDALGRETQQEWELFNRRFPYDQDADYPGPDEMPPEEYRRERDETEEGSLISILRDYGEKDNIRIILIDSSTGQVLLNAGRETDFLAMKLMRYILGLEDEENEQVLFDAENYRIVLGSDPRSGNNYLEGWGYFSDTDIQFLMQMPLMSIRESVDLANRFTTYVGLIVLVVGCFVMYFVTRRITEPIKNLAVLSERMSNLDFDVHYEGDEQDELGILGNSMNRLSENLKNTIGALRQANVQLQKDIQEKIEIDDVRREFIADVSHELKTPIALIQGYAEGLTEGMAEDEESRDYYCEVIMDEANKMNQMVKQLLTLSALEYGSDEPDYNVFDINELIDEFLASASILIAQHEARVTFENNGPVLVWADEFKIEEVLTNYLNNALNHLNDEHEIRISTAVEGERVKVSVFNTGDHIPDDSLQDVWTKFYKVDKARSREYGGSGIGLSIVKAVMDAHHQECGVENVEGGVKFWFTLEVVHDNEVLNNGGMNGEHNGDKETGANG